MNAEGDDASGVARNEPVQPRGRVGTSGVVKARSLKKALRRFVLEAMLKVGMVVLVRLGVDDDRVVDLRLGEELQVVREVGGLGTIGPRRRVREPRLVLGEQMNVRVDQHALRTSGGSDGSGGERSDSSAAGNRHSTG